MNNTEETNAGIAAAEAQAACYTGEPRLDECFKADIMNAFFAGSAFQKERTAKQIAAPGTAKQRYTELRVEDEESDPVERLRAFCSLAMNGQDWVDVEPFFDAVISKLASKPDAEYLTIYEQECQDIAADGIRYWKDKYETLVESLNQEPDEPKLAVWYGSMPETNGKTNWTAILYRGDIATGITLDRSEYPDRVRYEADRARWLIGELPEQPFILDYDADKHSGYVPPIRDSANEQR
jgi:hypothetical protein